MRSYPLLGLFLVTRHAVSKTPSNPAILRPMATGISLLFLSLKHSSAVIEVRVTGVTGWPQCWEVILPLPASASQRRKLRERWICGTCPCCLRHMDRWRWEGKGSLQWTEICSACDHLRGVLTADPRAPHPSSFDSAGRRWDPGDCDTAGRQIQLWGTLVRSRGSGSELCLDSQARVSTGAWFPKVGNTDLDHITWPKFSI